MIVISFSQINWFQVSTFILLLYLSNLYLSLSAEHERNQETLIHTTLSWSQHTMSRFNVYVRDFTIGISWPTLVTIFQDTFIPLACFKKSSFMNQSQTIIVSISTTFVIYRFHRVNRKYRIKVNQEVYCWINSHEPWRAIELIKCG